MSSPLIKPTAWLSGDSLDLMNFIVRKSKTARTPMRLIKLCEEFIEETGSQVLKSTLDSRLRLKLRPKIPEIEDLDLATKAKLMFVLGGAVDSAFFNELKEGGNVQLDERNRIVSYVTKGGYVVCSGRHTDYGPTEREVWKDNEFLDYLNQFSERYPEPMTLVAFGKKFKIARNCPLSEGTIAARLSSIRNTIYSNLSYSKTSRIRMMFVSGATINENILAELRKYATVEVDDDMRITYYKANNSSLELKGKPTRRSGVGSRFSQGIVVSLSPTTPRSASKRDYNSNISSKSPRNPPTTMTSRTRLYGRSDPIPRKMPRQVSTRGLAGFSEEQDMGSSHSTHYGESTPSSQHSWFSRGGVESSRDVTPRGNQMKQEQLPASIKLEYVESPPQARPHRIHFDDFVNMSRDSTVISIPGSRIGQRNFPTSSARASQSSDEEAFSKDYLLMLRSIVRSLDSFILGEVMGQIEQAIETVGEKKIRITDLLAVLQSGLLIFKKTATAGEISQNSTSLKEFLLILRSGLFSHRTAILDDFQAELKGIIDELHANDKALPIQSIRPVLEMLLLLITA